MSDEPSKDDFARALFCAERDALRGVQDGDGAAASRVLLYLLSRPQPSEPGAEALAKAWDEGYHAARYDSPARGHASNPYRSKP